MPHVTSHTLPAEVSDVSAFIQGLAGLILLSNTEFEDVWDIASRVCDQYASEIAAIPSKRVSTENHATAA